VEEGGFEPPKAEPSDLQSDPFDRSGTPPKLQACILHNFKKNVNDYEKTSTLKAKNGAGDWI